MKTRPASKTALLIAFVVSFSTLLIAACGVEAEPDATPAAVAGTAVAGTTAAFPEPTVWVDTSPRLVQPGQSVIVMGQGFSPAEVVDVVVRDGTHETLAGMQGTTDLRGGLPSKTTLQLPNSVVTGTYSVVVRGQTSGREGMTNLWIQTSLPTIELSHDSLHPQDLLTINGRGFVPRERVVIYFAGRGDDPLTAVNADQLGNLQVANLPIPQLDPGDQQIVATGAISMGQATRPVRLLPFEPVVFVSAEALPSGGTAGIFGSGFASNDDITVNLEGSDAMPSTISTDGMGRLNAPQAFEIPSEVKGQQTFALSARKTGKKLRVSFQAVPSYPIVELGSTSGMAGSQIGVAARGLRPRERVDVYLAPTGGARKRLASFRADDNGWLRADSQIVIPPETPPGLITLALDGEAARPPIRLRFNVTAS